MDLLVGFLAVLLLIGANGWFVLNEFAFVAARPGHVAERADAGDRRAAHAVGVQRRLSFMLSGAQLGITATSLLIGYLSRPVFGQALSPWLQMAGLPEPSATALALGSGLLLATAAQMIFGELAPKNLGIARAEDMAVALAGSMRVYLAVARPLVRLFDGASNALLRRIGIEPAEQLSGGVTPEELGVIIHESGRGGVLADTTATLLGRVLGLRTLRVSDVMVARPQVVAIPDTATCEDLRRLAVDSGHSRFPVVGEGLDDVRGVVQAKDILDVPVERRASTTVAELASAPPVVPESGHIAPLLADLRAARSQLAIVVDEHGGTAGVVTLEDIVEEIVGQIRDEYDREEPAAQPLPGGAWLVPGSWRPDEVARDTGLALPEGDYETVSGLVMEHLGRVPGPGDVVDLGTLRIRVEHMDGMAVGRVRLVPHRQPPRDGREARGGPAGDGDPGDEREGDRRDRQPPSDPGAPRQDDRRDRQPPSGPDPGAPRQDDRRDRQPPSGADPGDPREGGQWPDGGQPR